MRGPDTFSESLFTFKKLDDFVPATHPLRAIRTIRQVMVRGLKKVDQLFVLNMAAYNLVRMRSLGQVRPQVAR